MKYPRRIDTADPSAVDELYSCFRPSIPADRAMLCLDCNSIFEVVGDQSCPSCGSREGMLLGRILCREAV